jgi:hypothetical protein
MKTILKTNRDIIRKSPYNILIKFIHSDGEEHTFFVGNAIIAMVL